ncbi:MAG: hypothetical protein ACOC5S_03150 [Acidobacteriota bacterium]
MPEKDVADKIHIDYDKVSSADIMNQIKEEISKQNKPLKGKGSTVPDREKGSAMKSFIKIVLSKLARPLRSLIKVLIQESYQDLMADTYERLNRLEQEEGDPRKKEYIKLLYGLSHNIVVELTKLKIEVEDLRVKLSILEKDFENFKKRERALEKRVFK